MAAHFYSNTASVAQVGAGGLTTSTTAMPVNIATYTGFPASFPYWVEIGQGTAGAEIVEVTSGSGSSYTVTRAQGGTSAAAHNAGDTITHIIPADMPQSAEAHLAATSGVHGATGSVVGTTGFQSLQDKMYRGGFRHDFSDTNPPSLAAGLEIDADTADAKDGVVVHNTAANPDRRAFLLDQAGTPRVQVYNDGTVDIAPSGASRPGLRNRGTTELDGTVTVSGELDAGGVVSLTGTTTVTSLTAGSETVTGDLTLPMPVSGVDVTPRIQVAGNSGQPLFRGLQNSTQNVLVDSSGNATLAGNASVGGNLSATGNGTVTGSLSVQGGKILTPNTNSGHDWSVTSQFRRPDNVDLVRNLRQSFTWGIRNVGLTTGITSSDSTLWSVLFTPHEDCELRINLTANISNGQGGSGSAYEPCQAVLGYKIQSPDGTTTYLTSDLVYNYNSQGSPTWTKGGVGTVPIAAAGISVTGGTQYNFILHGNKTTVLGPTLNSVIGYFEEAAFLGWLVNA